ncbi:hypothetical protein DSCOOX_05940 [Desulfosarcina ovata subsp. ovata]|uniref:Type II secretion system protein H n=2 Tax=Desulfosarcina ovata TaxID=83564 RepID=A0A5K8A4Y6_9BACT|nr:hypothetical protein DSCOOX_05940 [Desulfosarcina ovata subsp. ovata]
MRGNSGFSLFEVLTVIAIIAVVAAIAVPNMIAWRNRAKLGEGARDIYSAFQLARSGAAKENADVIVSFDTSVTQGGDFIVFIDDGGGIDADDDGVIDDADNGQADPDTETIFKIGKLPSGVTIDYTALSIKKVTFSSNGLLKTGFGLTVKVLSTSGEEREVVVSSAGRVRIAY